MNQATEQEEAPAVIATFDTEDVADARIRFIIKLGQALHRYGTPTHRLEQAMKLILNRLGLEGEFLSTPTGIFASFGRPEEHRTALIRVEPGEVNLEKLVLLDDLAGSVIRGSLDAAEGSRLVDTFVAAPPRYGAWMTTLSFGLASGASTQFFGGGWREALAAGVIGLMLGALASLTGRSTNTARLFEATAAIFASVIAVAAMQILDPLSFYITTLAGLIVLIPGLTLTTGIRELATRNLISGTASLMSAGLVFFELGFGVALGSQIQNFLPPADLYLAPVPLPTWTLYVALIVAPLAFVVLLKARPRDAVWILLAGWLAFGGARTGAYLLGQQLGAFVGAIVIGAASNLCARLRNQPASVTLVPGILLLVPGSIGFGSFLKFIERDVLSGIETAFQMLLVAVALATGLLIANVIVPPRQAL
ncbi:MAG: threonine/serine exporter family protein [Pyrinomonadaceae bacterium MAG19_C2-C3]|nr:threonine/serine exporter family protein [Pyrinomonadaceae bacterium MAG19_C2-C3]